MTFAKSSSMASATHSTSPAPPAYEKAADQLSSAPPPYERDHGRISKPRTAQTIPLRLVYSNLGPFGKIRKVPTTFVLYRNASYTALMTAIYNRLEAYGGTDVRNIPRPERSEVLEIRKQGVIHVVTDGMSWEAVKPWLFDGYGEVCFFFGMTGVQKRGGAG